VRTGRGSRPTVHRGIDWIRTACSRGINGIVCPEAIVRTSAQLEVGGYRPEVPYSSDMEMWLRLATIGDVIQDRGDYAAFTRTSPQSMSAVAEASMARTLQIRRDAFDVWHEYAADVLPDADALLARAHHTLARTAMFRAYVAFSGNPADPEAQQLAQLAAELDPQWATGAARRFGRLAGHGMIRKIVGAASPASRLWYRGYRFTKVTRRRITRFPVA
jgi:hypothetical protein